MASPHTKVLKLEIESSQKLVNKPTNFPSKSVNNYRKQLVLFKLIRNNLPKSTNFSPMSSNNSYHLSIPEKKSEKKTQKITDFSFDKIDNDQKIVYKIKVPEKQQGSKKQQLGQVHYVKKFKSIILSKIRPQNNQRDSALLISKKRIMPASSSRMSNIG